MYPQTPNQCVCSPIQLISGPCLCSVSRVEGNPLCILYLIPPLFSAMQKHYFDTYICSLSGTSILRYISHYFAWNSFSLVCLTCFSLCLYLLIRQQHYMQQDGLSEYIYTLTILYILQIYIIKIYIPFIYLYHCVCLIEVMQFSFQHNKIVSLQYAVYK